MNDKLVDHLFRHHYGKMVSILTRIFGLPNLQLIEDAIQDAYISAIRTWRDEVPDNPEAWLTRAAKNRAIDLFRKVKAERNRIEKHFSGPAAIQINDLFLENEVEDAQLRMIFTACHPALDIKDQMAFALKTISGFGIREIAASLLLKEETVKKRLTRARHVIAKENISFEIPDGQHLPNRLKRVLKVIYLTFNEGFQSIGNKEIVRPELCGEALRLCRLLLKREALRSAETYALFALMCFHSARLESKIGDENQIRNLKDQDRTKWHRPLIILGNDAMIKATESGEYSTYHYEAAIASEHLKAATFEETNWSRILMWYEKLYQLEPSPMTLLNKSIVLMHAQQLEEAFVLLQSLEEANFENRHYLYYGAMAELCLKKNDTTKAIEYLDMAISKVLSPSEKRFLLNKKQKLLKID